MDTNNRKNDISSVYGRDDPCGRPASTGRPEQNDYPERASRPEKAQDSCIILAGGRSTRMGSNKALLPLPGQEHLTFVQYLASILTPLCSETILVARDPADAANYILPGVQVVADSIPDQGPLMGLYSGLSVIHTRRALVVAVDMPFIPPALITFLPSQPQSDTLLVPLVNNIPQVLLALYPRTVLPLIEECIQQGRHDPRSLLRTAPVQYIEETQLRSVDPELRSFINVNTPEDLRKNTIL